LFYKTETVLSLELMTTQQNTCYLYSDQTVSLRIVFYTLTNKERQ